MILSRTNRNRENSVIEIVAICCQILGLDVADIDAIYPDLVKLLNVPRFSAPITSWFDLSRSWIGVTIYMFLGTNNHI